MKIGTPVRSDEILNRTASRDVTAGAKPGSARKTDTDAVSVSTESPAPSVDEARRAKVAEIKELYQTGNYFRSRDMKAIAAAVEKGLGEEVDDLSALAGGR